MYKIIENLFALSLVLVVLPSGTIINTDEVVSIEKNYTDGHSTSYLVQLKTTDTYIDEKDYVALKAKLEKQ